MKFQKAQVKATAEVCVGPPSGGAEGTFQLEAVLRAKLPCCWREEGRQKSLVKVRNAERYLWKRDASHAEAEWPRSGKGKQFTPARLKIGETLPLLTGRDFWSDI